MEKQEDDLRKRGAETLTEPQATRQQVAGGERFEIMCSVIVRMIHLRKRSGLPITLSDTSLVFGGGMVTVEPSARALSAMRPFLMGTQAEFRKPAAYYMYRKAGLRKNVESFSENHLRYDLTVMESGKIGREFVKTIGHYHPFKPGTTTRYPEIYEVIQGQAMFVLQKIGADDSTIEEVYVARAKAGEKVLMLPGCGHVTVNIGNTPLVMGNIVSDRFSSNYDPYREKRGACYYILEERGRPKLEPNRLYGSVPHPLSVRPRARFLGLSKQVPLYVAASKDPTRLRWLNSPEQFTAQLTVENVFNTL
jgi:glucose-6-phosphate isomerase